MLAESASAWRGSLSEIAATPIGHPFI